MELNCNFQVRALSKRKLNKVCFGIAIFLFSLKAVGLKAQQVQPGSSTLTSESVETNIPGVMAYRATPKAFDAETASELELARYRLPRDQIQKNLRRRTRFGRTWCERLMSESSPS